jgi:hypothetical protein
MTLRPMAKAFRGARVRHERFLGLARASTFLSCLVVYYALNFAWVGRYMIEPLVELFGGCIVVLKVL